MTLEKLLEYGHMLVAEQENVKRVQLADKYLSKQPGSSGPAAVGDDDPVAAPAGLRRRTRSAEAAATTEGSKRRSSEGSGGARQLRGWPAADVPAAQDA
uniref:Uncharacterized protein n=1 Tax=Setaria italica TaxID=4555 RepID=K3ZLH6_SETIT